MKKIDVSQTLQILGNAGVLVGILLLVYELNQNRDMMAAGTRNEVAQTLATMLRDDSSDAKLRDIQIRFSAGEELTPVERLQVSLNWIAYFRLWENMHYQYRNGLFDNEEYLAEQEAWRRNLADPAIREVWCSRQDEVSRQFADEIDRLLGDAPCE
jgi:hypothetical protein